jgi:hypothetical protein
LKRILDVLNLPPLQTASNLAMDELKKSLKEKEEFIVILKIEFEKNVIEELLRTKYQYSIEKPHKKSTKCLEKEIISNNKPLRGGNLLLPHLNVQVQDDSK